MSLKEEINLLKAVDGKGMRMPLLEQLIEDMEEQNVITPEKMEKIILNLSIDHFQYIEKYTQLLSTSRKNLRKKMGKIILEKMTVSEKIPAVNNALKLGDILIGIIDDLVYVFMFEITGTIHCPWDNEGDYSVGFKHIVDKNLEDIVKNFGSSSWIILHPPDKPEESLYPYRITLHKGYDYFVLHDYYFNSEIHLYKLEANPIKIE